MPFLRGPFLLENKILGLLFFSLQNILGSNCHETLYYILILITRYKLCAVIIRHIIGTSEDVSYNQYSKSSGFGTEGHYPEIYSSG